MVLPSSCLDQVKRRFDSVVKEDHDKALPRAFPPGVVTAVLSVIPILGAAFVSPGHLVSCGD